MQKIAYIMRGVSGSGKSTVARSLAGETGVIHSTDEYFMVDGVYSFDPSRLGEYHERNFMAFCESLKSGVPVVVCDNTNTRHWEYERYLDVAMEHGYVVAVIALPHPDPKFAGERNVHGVPEGVIRHMLSRWEE